MSELLNKYLPSVIEAQTWFQDDQRTIAFVTLNGLNRMTVNHSSSTVYEVIAGDGKVVIDGVTSELRAGDSFTAPIGKAYQDEGHLTMLATSTPPFNSGAVEILK